MRRFSSPHRWHCTPVQALSRRRAPPQATRWLFVARRRLDRCAVRVGRVAASQLCSQLAACCWWAWVELRRDADTKLLRNSVAFKHVARSLVARHLGVWRAAVQRRTWLMYANMAALRHWAYARQTYALRAWRWTGWAERMVRAVRWKASQARLWRSLACWAEQTPFVRSTGSDPTGSPGLVEWAFASKYRDSRRLAISVDTWATHLRWQRRVTLLKAKVWQHRQYAVLATAIRSWQMFIVVAKHMANASRLAEVSREASQLKTTLAAWVLVRKQSEANAASKVRAQSMSRARRYLRAWQIGIKVQRSATKSIRSLGTRMQTLVLSEWSRVVQLTIALHAMDDVAIGIALSRLARKSVDGWMTWRNVQVQKKMLQCAAVLHHHRTQVSAAVMQWRRFVVYKVRRYAMKRQARQHHRSRRLRRTFGTWLCYHARLDKEYAALQRALQKRQRANSFAAFVGWQLFKVSSQARRLQFLHAEGYREAVLSAAIMYQWCEAIEMLKVERSRHATACQHADLQLLFAVLSGWAQAAELSATLRWAKQSRLSALRASLDLGRLRRSWAVWSGEIVTGGRAKANKHKRAVCHIEACRVRKCMAMLSEFLAQRRFAKRKITVAVKQYGATLLAATFTAAKKYTKTSQKARSRRNTAVLHSHEKLLRVIWDAWLAHVAKRRRKAAAEAAALERHRSRLLEYGCRGWLQGGLERRTARVESVLAAEGHRATALMVVVERLARHWRNKTLERLPERQHTNDLHRIELRPTLSASVGSPATAEAARRPAVAMAAPSFQAPTAESTIPSIPIPRSRPSPRRPPLLFGATAAAAAVAGTEVPPRLPTTQLHVAPRQAAVAPRMVAQSAGDAAPAMENDSLTQMAAVLGGYRELKESRQRARTALVEATTELDASSGAGSSSLKSHVGELRVEVRDLERRCAEQLPAVRAVAKRLELLQAQQ